MSQYLLLLRSNPADFAGRSAEEMQQLVQKVGEWRKSLQDRIAIGKKLMDGEGRVLRKNGAKPSVTDGPFVEAKEVMGGFFLIEAENYDQATEIAKSCPLVDYGSIEIRAIQQLVGT